MNNRKITKREHQQLGTKKAKVVMKREKEEISPEMGVTPASSVPSQSSSERTTINLVKTIVGAGVLTIPCGMARLSDNGVLPTEIIIIITF